MKKMFHKEMMEKLLKFNTPSVANIVATYLQNPHCFGLYDPWGGKWYTDHSVRCVFPEMERRVGHAFMMVVSIPDPKQPELPSLSFMDLIVFKQRQYVPLTVT